VLYPCAVRLVKLISPEMSPAKTTYLDYVRDVTELPLTFDLLSTGDGSGVATLSMESSESVKVILSDFGKFYTDAAGTLGESDTWTITPGAVRTIYLRCT